MRAVLAPEPAPWLMPLLATTGTDDLMVFAPWALPSSGLLELLPRRLQNAWRRRQLDAGRVRSVPGWPVLDAVVRRAPAARAIAWRLRQREWLDALASKLLGTDVEEVIAPSLTALRTFAATPKARHVLIEDLPGLRQLHADLDHAARRLPACSFLQNFRAHDGAVVRQEQEYVLATTVRVRSRWAQQRARRAGASPDALEPLTFEPELPRLRHDPTSTFVLLAGTTASRFGLEVVLNALRDHPSLVLLAREGEGSHAASLSHPRLQLLRSAPPAISAVVAPSWVEASPVEVTAGIAANIPVIATTRVLGWHDPSPRVRTIEPGDHAALSAELRSLSIG